MNFKSARTGLWLSHVFFLVLIGITFRHCWIEGDHLWTGEGARLSWSMRLRGKACAYQVKAGPGNPDEDMKWHQPSFKMLSFFQLGNLDDPFVFYLYVKNVLCPSQKTVFSRVICRPISHVASGIINPEVDLCHTDYSYLHHNKWISAHPGSWDADYIKWFKYHQQQSESRLRRY